MKRSLYASLAGHDPALWRLHRPQHALAGGGGEALRHADRGGALRSLGEAAAEELQKAAAELGGEGVGPRLTGRDGMVHDASL